MENQLISQTMSSKIKIFIALHELLKANIIDSITVNRICEQAQVGKTTFYSHFKDKYEVAQWYVDLAHAVGAEQVGRSLTWENGHSITTKALVLVKPFLFNASKSNDPNSIVRYSFRSRIRNLEQTIVEYQKLSLTPKLKMQISAVAAGETEVASLAFSDRFSLSVDEIVETLISIVPRDLYKALEKPASLPNSNSVILQKRLELMMLQTEISQLSI